MNTTKNIWIVMGVVIGLLLSIAIAFGLTSFYEAVYYYMKPDTPIGVTTDWFNTYGDGSPAQFTSIDMDNNLLIVGGMTSQSSYIDEPESAVEHGILLTIDVHGSVTDEKHFKDYSRIESIAAFDNKIYTGGQQYGYHDSDDNNPYDGVMLYMRDDEIDLDSTIAISDGSLAKIIPITDGLIYVGSEQQSDSEDIQGLLSINNIEDKSSQYVTFGNEGSDFISDILKTEDGSYMAVGYSTSNPDGSIDDYDMWYIRISSDIDTADIGYLGDTNDQYFLSTDIYRDTFISSGIWANSLDMPRSFVCAMDGDANIIWDYYMSSKTESYAIDAIVVEEHVFLLSYIPGSSDDWDIVITCLDADDGRVIFSQNIGDENSEIPLGMTIYDGSIYIVGTYTTAKSDDIKGFVTKIDIEYED